MTRQRNDTLVEEEEEFRRALDSVPPPTPPDGGWGWVIVFSSFCMNFIVDGVCYSYGVLLPEVVATFHNSTAMMSLGGALLLGTYMLSGPVACALCNRFGSRKIAMLGCLISFISLLASLAVENGSLFVVIFGLCGGAGFGLMFLASVLMVGFYFERNRGVAATIAMCGSSMGMALLAPLTRCLFIEFNNLNNTVTLITGIVIQGFVLAALQKPLDADLRRRKKLILKRMEEDKMIGPQTCVIMQRLLEEKRRQRIDSTGSLNNTIITRDNTVIREKDLYKHSFLFRIKAALSRSNVNLASGSHQASPRSSRTNSVSVRHRPAPNSPQLPAPPSILIDEIDSTPTGTPEPSPRPTRSRSSSPNDRRHQDLRRQVLISQTALCRQNSSKSLNAATTLSTNQNISGAEEGVRDFQSVQDMSACHMTAQEQYLLQHFLRATPNVDRPMYRKDILYSGTVRHLSEFHQHHDDINEYVASITSIPADTSDAKYSCWNRLSFLPKSMTDVLHGLFSTQMCRRPTFLLLAFSSSLTMFGYYVPFLLLPMYAVTVPGVSPLRAAYLLTVLGCSNTIGRIVVGVIGSRSWVDSLVLNNIALIIAGGSTVALPFCESYALQILFAAAFGVCVAAFSTLRSILVVQLIGLDQLTTCYNQLIIFHGLAIITGTPLACYLYDLTKVFDYSFYFAGGAIFLSGILSLPLRRLSDFELGHNGLHSSNNSSEDDMKKDALITPQAIEMVVI